MIDLNCYTRQQIKAATGEDVNSEIVVVGNTIERHALEQYILKREPVAVIGPPMSGKLSAVAQICEKHNIGIDFHYGELGDYDADNIHVVRNPKSYRNLAVSGLVVLSTVDKDIPTTFRVVRLTCAGGELQRIFCDKKGQSLVSRGSIRPYVPVEIALISQHLGGKSIAETLPSNTHRWIARNFYEFPNILKVCMMALNIKDRLIYWGLLRLVKASRFNLKYPIWVKTNDRNNGRNDERPSY